MRLQGSCPTVCSTDSSGPKVGLDGLGVATQFVGVDVCCSVGKRDVAHVVGGDHVQVAMGNFESRDDECNAIARKGLLLGFTDGVGRVE